MRVLDVEALALRSAALLVLSCALAGCGDGGEGGGGSDAGPDASLPALDSPQKIHAYLEEKTLTMEGEGIPSHPFGFDERTNFGAATQCYQSVTTSVSAGNWQVQEVRGTLNGAPGAGDTGTCDHTTASGQLSFTSTQVLLENVDDECFDITLTFPGLAQEGRGKISADGKTISLELFFANQAEGHRCADGPVGGATIEVNGAPFTGNAVQVFTIE